MEEQSKESMKTDQSKEQKDTDQQNITEVIDPDETADVKQSADESKSENLNEKVDQLQKEKDDIMQRMLRIQAEYDNFKKRSQKEKEAERKYKAQDLVNDLLPAIDNFERALQVEVNDESSGFVEGISMVYRQINDALKAQGVEEIECVGKPFDPNLHHAVMQVEEEEHDSDIVVEELQKGYMLKDKVIRPAMVKVNK